MGDHESRIIIRLNNNVNCSMVGPSGPAAIVRYSNLFRRGVGENLTICWKNLQNGRYWPIIVSDNPFGRVNQQEIHNMKKIERYQYPGNEYDKSDREDKQFLVRAFWQLLEVV